MQIYIHHNGQQLGPFTEAEVKAQLASGAISLQDHAWWEGQAGWVALAQTPLATPVAFAPPGYVPPAVPAPGTLGAPIALSGAPATSNLAIWALVCGVVGLFCFITEIPAIILGHLSLAEIRKNPQLKGRGMAVAGLVIGYLWLVLAVLVIVISVLVALGKQAKLKEEMSRMESASSDSTTNAADSDSSSSTTNAADTSTNAAPVVNP